MNYNEFKGIIQGLGYAFNKEYREQELKMFYRYFKDYTANTLIKAVDSIVTTCDKLPTIKQLIDKCDMFKSTAWMDTKIETPEPDEEWYELLNSFSK